MSRRRATTMIAAALACLAAATGRADAQGRARAGGHAPTPGEFAALKQQVERQNELIMRLTQLEGEHYEFLLKLLQNRRPGSAPVALPYPTPSPSPSSQPSAPASPSPSPSPSAAQSAPEPETASSATHAKLAAITGRVELRGKPWGPVYVYVENIKEPAVDRAAEMSQKDRAFVPSVLLVQRGTRVSFPNGDPFLHNVFSPSPVQPFDLGSYRQGEKPGGVRLFTPGVIEVLCNMHAKMRANILVVPNRHHVRVNGDGTFRLENVPVGTRQIVAWTPDAKPMTQTVTLTPGGASASFALQIEPPPPPIDKMGRPRAPYRSDE